MRNLDKHVRSYMKMFEAIRLILNWGKRAGWFTERRER